MANENPGNDVTGGQQVESPSESGSTSTTQRRSPDSQTTPSSSATAAPPLRKQSSNTFVPITSPSPVASPRTSRTTSPVRKDSKPQSLSNPPSQPSAAAIQRALSAATTPQLQLGAQDASSKLPKATTPKSGSGSGGNTPHWPTSPRLKSPPPSGSRRGSATALKKPEGEPTPSISVQSATPLTSTPPPIKQGGEEASKGPQLQTPAKGPSRGASGKSTLETVQENSADDIKEPSPAAVQAAADLKPLTKISDDESQPPKPTVDGEKHTQQGDSGSESAGRERRRDQSNNTQRSKSAQSRSYPSLAPAKSRQSDGKQNMTVETETVQSIPQSQLNAGDRLGGVRGENSGSVRHKPSSETLRPRKERKKTNQKPRSINQSTTSSKADIFEQRVAEKIDDQESDDSDDTYVYESNPPDPQRRVRHHSRTPSVASQHSVADQNRSVLRGVGDADERKVGGKRSMKFSNNAYNDPDSPENKDGSVRSHRPTHFGRFGRGGSQSVADPDSPYTQASKLRPSHVNTRRSRPNSPRTPNDGQPIRSSGLFGRKNETSYDMYADGDVDERAPLVGTVRTPRSRAPRRRESDYSIDEYYGVRRYSRCGKHGSTVMVVVLIAAVLLSAVGFLVMSNRPMYDLEIRKINNVLASEQELLLDLVVRGINPNALSISIADMNIDIFAKSQHVGPGDLRRQRGRPVLTTSISEPKTRRRKRSSGDEWPLPDLPAPWQDLSDHWHSPSKRDGVDEGTDPMDDPRTMLLGRIFKFDQALSFEGSPFKRHLHSSTGELRLERPGNKTETGGSERWERILDYPFELIIRGVLKYSLPISGRIESSLVSKSVIVHPEEGVNEFGNMRVEEVDRSEQWEWVEWGDYRDEVDGDA